MKPNIVFDMGQVLMDFAPPKFIARLGYTGEDAQALLQEVFKGWEWVAFDRGDVTGEDVVRMACSRLPARLHGAARELVFHWWEDVIPMPGAKEQHIAIIIKLGREPQLRLAEQVGMRGPDGLTCMAPALGEHDLRARVVHKDPQKLTCGVTGGPDDSDLNFIVDIHLQFLFKFLSLILMSRVIDPQRG
jgi:hypothetical protein